MDELVRSAEAPTVVVIGDLCVDTQKMTARIGKTALRLQPRERQVLVILSLAFCASTTEPVPRDAIIERLYPDRLGVTAVDVFISTMRKKMREASGGKNYIETLWGKGYKLSAPRDEGVEQISVV